MHPHQTKPQQSGLAGIVAAVLALAALAWFALGGTPALPTPKPRNAPSEQFSAMRAFAHVQALARTPRPIATRANADARNYLIERLRVYGLEPQVQTTTVQKESMDPMENVHVTLAVVHNVLVRLPGTASGPKRPPAVLLASHYDSGNDTQGAANGAASAAAMLETIRVLRAGPPLQHDVIFLFADGEQVGELGTQAFVEQHPWAHDVGLVLKFDNIGNRGPLVLYDVFKADSNVISGWAKAAKGVRGSAVMSEAYRLMWNRVPAGPLARLHTPLLQFATLDGDRGPHDTPERLDLATLQHEGDAMLGLVRHFGQQALVHETQADRVYFELPHLGIVHYPVTLVWPFTRLACLLLFGVCCLAAQRQDVALIDIVKGTFGCAAIAVTPAATAWLLWHNGFRQLVSGDWDGTRLCAIALLGGALFILALRRLQRAVGWPACVLGAMICAGAALVAISWSMPVTTYVLLWPLLGALTAYAALLSRRVAALPAARLPVLLAGAAPGVLLLLPLARDIFVPFSLARTNLALALLALMFCLSIPLFVQIARRFAVRGLAIAGLVLLGTANPALPEPGERPIASPLVYYKDMQTWRSWWLAPPQPLDDFTRSIFPNLPAPRRHVDVFGWDSDDLWYSAAPRNDGLAFPLTVMLKNEEEPRLAEFTVTSKNRAPHIEMWVDKAKINYASVNGRTLTNKTSRSWSMSLYGMEDQLLRFALRVAPHATFYVHVEERIPGLPEHALPERPHTARPVVPMTGTTVAADTLLFRGLK
ncbi:M28 family peptidase [Massilia horti]|uniref:Vacuolar membrane protease n=1 Tax=Massilia horti TaxID=2562153 RepID=A0A4Y9SUB5_9BURK|nr:M28 family peptidase [Massilia horti]TFW30300.1 M28 family peptidase [Massilia horti]